MAQCEGEAHTAHTFVGVTGGCTGFSLQSSEGSEAFGSALRDCMTTEMIDQVRFLYSDNPHEDMLIHLPNAVGVAEDFQPLCFRVKYCYPNRGHLRKRNTCIQELSSIQQKLRTPMPCDAVDLMSLIYHGEDNESDTWESVQRAEECAEECVAAYLAKPFSCHADYIAQLKRIAHKYEAHMQKKNKKDNQCSLCCGLARLTATICICGIMRYSYP